MQDEEHTSLPFLDSIIMAQQKSITFFFRKKREISEVDENDDVKEVKHSSGIAYWVSRDLIQIVVTTPKRAKTASNTPVASPIQFSQTKSNVSSPKSEEDKRVAERVENNRLLAKMKLETKATRGLVIDMGVSWYKAFEKEFSKEYFQKVMQ